MSEPVIILFYCINIQQALCDRHLMSQMDIPVHNLILVNRSEVSIRHIHPFPLRLNSQMCTFRMSTRTHQLSGAGTAGDRPVYSPRTGTGGVPGCTISPHIHIRQLVHGWPRLTDLSNTMRINEAFTPKYSK